MTRARTKQVCTIGPASADKIPDLVAAGMDVARINFSHGSAEDHRAYGHAVRNAAHSARRSVAVMVDLPGRKLRLGELDGGQVNLASGTTFALRAPAAGARSLGDAAESTGLSPVASASAREKGAEDAATAERAGSEVQAAAAPPELPAPVDLSSAPDASAASWAETGTESEPDTAGHVFHALPGPGDARGATVVGLNLSTLQVGDRVLLADGAVELRVTAVDREYVQTDVINGGLIRSRSGVSIPTERWGDDDNGLTDEDRAGVSRALELRADLIAQSFVRSAADIAALRALLPVDGPRVVAKIETRSAVDDFEAIVAVADGIMVARGDLGVDIPFEDVPMIQKELVRRTQAADKFAIVATQMLESMTAAPRPTRAEASDVANAVLDGADAVMLSAETAIGTYPVESLSAMERICLAVEKKAYDSTERSKVLDPGHAVVLAAASISSSGGATAIWCFTRTGRTAEMLSNCRPNVPVVAFTLSPVVARRLAVRRGVIPLVLAAGAKNRPLVEQMEAAWRAQRSAEDHKTVLLVTTSGQPGGINRLEVHRLVPTGRGPQSGRDQAPQVRGQGRRAGEQASHAAEEQAG